MYGVGGSDAISRDVESLLFSSNFKYSSPGEFAKSKDVIRSDVYDYNHNLHQLPQQQSSNLTRYRSAPSSLFASLLDDGSDGGGGGVGGDINSCEDYLNSDSNPEPEMMFSRFSSGENDSRDLKYPTNLKQEMVESVPLQKDYSAADSRVAYTAPAAREFPNRDSVSSMDNSLRAMNGMDSLNQLKSSNGNGSNLIRQSSSPGFLSTLADEIVFGGMNEVGNFRGGINRTNVEVNSLPSRSNNNKNFSSRPSSCSRFMPQIAEGENENVETTSLGNGPNGDHTNNSYLSNIPSSTFTNLKRDRDGEMKMFSGFNGFDNQNGDSRYYNSGLAHQLSLPSTSSEMATVEKLMQFQQDSVPCKIRAKRGFATHPRSIAERVRRTRISERMKKLQDLFPNMDKQANTAEMLDLAVKYIKDLQKEVQTLKETRGRCTCSGKSRQTSPTT